MSCSKRSYFGVVMIIVGLVAVTAGIIILISFVGSRKAITDMARLHQAQISANVQSRLSSFIDLPHALNEVNSSFIFQNPESLNDLESLGERILNQLKAFERVQNMAVGVEKQGNFIGSGRTDDGMFTLAIRDKVHNRDYRLFKYDEHGQKVELLQEMPDYDARERPWYKTAVQAGESTWSPIYIWASGRSMGLSAVLPIFDDQGNLLGVHQTASSLEFISKYLQGVVQSKGSQAFLLDPDGLLVATSVAEEIVQSNEQGLERLAGRFSSDHLTRQASIYLNQYLEDESEFEDHVHFNLNVEGLRYFVTATILSDMRGLDWVLVTSTSEDEIMSDINKAQRANLGIVLAATLAAITLGTLIARKLASFQERLRFLATTDELTYMWNRRRFTQATRNELERAHRYQQIFSLLMLDIDYFKKINDTYGHGAGDEVLRHIAYLIRQSLRQVDMPGRFGGEEFAIILPHTDLDGAYLTAERIRQCIENTPAVYNNIEIPFSVSIGVATYQDGIKNEDEIYKMADDALYEAKRKGRNLTVTSSGK